MLEPPTQTTQIVPPAIKKVSFDLDEEEETNNDGAVSTVKQKL